MGERQRGVAELRVVDVCLAAVAGHKVVRLVATDDVTSPLRAPFVESTLTPEGDICEKPAGRGLRLALGQLLTCPSCIGQWACAGFVTGMLMAPRPTRAAASMFAADALSDFLHIAFAAAKNRA